MEENSTVSVLNAEKKCLICCIRAFQEISCEKCTSQQFHATCLKRILSPEISESEENEDDVIDLRKRLKEAQDKCKFLEKKLLRYENGVKGDKIANIEADGCSNNEITAVKGDNNTLKQVKLKGCDVKNLFVKSKDDQKLDALK